MADSQVKTANICNITSGTMLYANAGGSGTYIADNSISVHMASGNPASGIYATPLSESSVIGDKYTISFIPICATNSTLLIELAGVQTRITFTSGERKSVTIQAIANNRNVGFYGGDSVEKTIIIRDIQIEKGETATPYRPYSATGWQHSLRKLTTATDTLTNLPVDIYADGTDATVGLKGNTVQNGTPTPQNPIQPSECGDRTRNLYNSAAQNIQNGFKDGYRLNQGSEDVSADNSITEYIPISAETKYTLKLKLSAGWTSSITYYDSSKNRLSYTNYENRTTISITTPQNAAYMRFTTTVSSSANYGEDMLVEGETAPTSYIPYGYKIPISSASTTTPVYLGETQSTRRIKKLVFDGTENWSTKQTGEYQNFALSLGANGIRTQEEKSTHFQCIRITEAGNTDVGFCIIASGLELRIRPENVSTTSLNDFKAYLAQQYTAGTPVTIWYVLATETTAIVNEPLMKIGEYADEVSGVTIPTIAGGDTISVDTTVQPSEVSLSYTGWHDATVKEYDGSDWQ